MQKELFDITGMTCSACSARVERGLSKLDGVESVSVNLLANSMAVTFDARLTDVDRIVEKVTDIGYDAKPRNQAVSKAAAAGSVKSPSDGGLLHSAQPAPQSEAQSLRRRLVVSLIFTVPLFYLSMGSMLHWPMPALLNGMENAFPYAITLLLLTLPVLYAGRVYFLHGFKNLARRSPNMDSLIAIGSGAAFVYGVFIVCRMAWGLANGEGESVHHYAMDLYFESAAMILTLITLGKYLEARAKSRTSAAIVKLMDLTPKTAIVLRGTTECTVSASEVETGDILVVKEGSSVPVDGTVTEGSASLDESAITGESLPVLKQSGDRVTGGTVSRSGYFKMKATAVGEETTLAGIIRLVEEATSSKAPIAKLADQISGVFVPIVIAIAVCAAAVWLLLGYGVTFSLTAGISVLVISCPCALGLATPAAIMVGTGKGASNGILFKSAEALETLHRTDTVVLDKTGTVTEGKPVVTDIFPHDVSEAELLACAASLEHLSGHPLAAPVLERAAASGVSLYPVTDYQLVPGRGITGSMDGIPVCGGNRQFMVESGINTEAYDHRAETLAGEGKTVLYFARGGALIGCVAVADPVRPTSGEAVNALTRMGLDVVMLTGDNRRTAEAVSKQAGITRMVAEVLPGDKEREIRLLREQGKRVVMVGDGINDAPALARADVGIAIGSGTDIAIESADIILIKNDLRDVVTALRLSKAVMRNIKQNLFWAFIYNIIGIPVAAGVFYTVFGWLLSPMAAAAAMSFSSVSVVTNALRLNLFDPKRKGGR